MSFDRHMNIVLGDCEEYRKIPAKKGKGGNCTTETHLLIRDPPSLTTE